MPQRVNVSHFVKAALEASIVASPDAPGLSEAQLVMVGADFGLEEGELLDAAMIGCTGDVEYVGGRYRLTSKGGEGLQDFSRLPKHDLRNPVAFERVQVFFRELARKRRIHNAVAEKGAVLSHVLAQGGVSEEDTRSAIAMLVLAKCLSAESDRLSLVPGFERYTLPSEALSAATRYERAIPPMAKLLAAVRSALVHAPYSDTSAKPINIERATTSGKAADRSMSPFMKNPFMKSGTEFPAAVVFVLIKGLRDCTDAPQIPQALSALNSAVRDIHPDVFVLSTIAGSIIVIPDHAAWSVNETLSALARAKVGFALRVGVAHGPLDVVMDVDGEANIIGPAINIAARLATAQNNDGCLVHETYTNYAEGALSSSDWLHRSRRVPLTVKGKQQDPLFTCFPAPLKFEAIPLEDPPTINFQRAVMIAYDLPMFSAGDRAQLRKRFNGVVDTFEKLRGTSSVGSRAVLSPGGDGGVLVIIGETLADAGMLAERLRSLATTESLDRGNEISIESRIGVHYGHVALYTNARGMERPAGRDLFVTDEIAGDEAARARAGVVVTQMLADNLAGGSKLRLDTEFEALEPIKSGPAADIPRYVRRSSPWSANGGSGTLAGASSESLSSAPKPATAVNSAPRPDIRVNVVVGVPVPLPLDPRLRVVLTVTIENHSTSDFYFGGTIVFVLNDGSVAQPARDGITEEWIQVRVVKPGDSLSHFFSAEVLLQTAASRGLHIKHARIFDKIKREYNSDPEQMATVLDRAQKLLSSS